MFAPKLRNASNCGMCWLSSPGCGHCEGEAVQKTFIQGTHRQRKDCTRTYSIQNVHFDPEIHEGHQAQQRTNSSSPGQSKQTQQACKRSKSKRSKSKLSKGQVQQKQPQQTTSSAKTASARGRTPQKHKFRKGRIIDRRKKGDASLDGVLVERSDWGSRRWKDQPSGTREAS